MGFSAPPIPNSPLHLSSQMLEQDLHWFNIKEQLLLHNYNVCVCFCLDLIEFLNSNMVSIQSHGVQNIVIMLFIVLSFFFSWQSVRLRL